jgi:hypothetical protein
VMDVYEPRPYEPQPTRPKSPGEGSPYEPIGPKNGGSDVMGKTLAEALCVLSSLELGIRAAEDAMRQCEVTNIRWFSMVKDLRTHRDIWLAEVERLRL